MLYGFDKNNEILKEIRAMLSDMDLITNLSEIYKNIVLSYLSYIWRYKEEVKNNATNN